MNNSLKLFLLLISSTLYFPMQGMFARSGSHIKPIRLTHRKLNGIRKPTVRHEIDKIESHLRSLKSKLATQINHIPCDVMLNLYPGALYPNYDFFFDVLDTSGQLLMMHKRKKNIASLISKTAKEERKNRFTQSAKKI